MSDTLAKQLDRHIAAVVLNQPQERKLLRDGGWKEFVDEHRPETDCPIEMAAEALCFIGVTDEGHWSGLNCLILGCYTFLAGQCRRHPSEQQLVELNALLCEIPVDREAVKAWFGASYLR